MRGMICFLLILSTAACAQATVRVFVTDSGDGYGLENPANHMVPTESTVYANGLNVNGYDYADYYGSPPGPLRPGSFPPADSLPGIVAAPIVIDPGNWAYIWLQFQNEPKGARINGLQVAISYIEGGSAPVATTYYLCNNTDNLISDKRWDGTATPPAYPEWHNNPQTMVAITAYGLQNTGATLPWNLWNGTSRIALLGAVEAPADGTIYKIELDAGPLFPAVGGGVFQFLPEPASLILICFAVLLVRRRM